MNEARITEKTSSSQPRWLTIVRIALGFILFWKGISFIRDSSDLHLMLQRMAPLTSRKPLLGEILVAQGWSTPEQVAELLMRQTDARMADQGSGRPDPLGELLLRQGHISLNQLHSALITQLRASQTGKSIRIGEVLVRENAISAEQLGRALRQQEVTYRQLYY